MAYEENKTDEPVETLTAVEARQGSRNYGLRVLVISSTLVVVVLGLAYLIGGVDEDDIDKTATPTGQTAPPNVPAAAGENTGSDAPAQ